MTRARNDDLMKEVGLLITTKQKPSVPIAKTASNTNI